MPPPLPPPITSRTNARVKELRASLSGQARRAGDLLGLEGEHLVGEALRSGLKLEAVFIRQGSEAIIDRLNQAALGDTPAVLLSPAVFDSAVTTASPQGVAATWRIAEPAAEQPVQRFLILEQLQDPGNLGTLIRTFEAFGPGEILVTPGTASPWNPKALRSSAGSAFRVSVRTLPLDEIVLTLRTRGVRIFAAVVAHESVGAPAPHGVLFGKRRNGDEPGPAHRDAQGVPLRAGSGPSPSLSYDADFVFPFGILIGNEGAGLSAEALASADERVTIPCSVESLNAAIAGSILLYEAMRQVPLRVWAQSQGLRP